MFSYYGSKSKIVHLYPPPKHDLLIEPFAGSARYALRYFERDVVLVDRYDKLIAIWKYLQQASERDVLSLPKLKHGDAISNYKELSEVERWFLGFLVINGVESPRNAVGSFNGVDVARDLKTIAKQLFKIRHWQFVLGSYECLRNVTATWFVDPPYYKGGEYYIYKNKQIDYEKLREWSESRFGQVIVCENSKAQWMPFVKLCRMGGSKYQTTEVFWTNETIEHQYNLFNPLMNG